MTNHPITDAELQAISRSRDATPDTHRLVNEVDRLNVEINERNESEKKFIRQLLECDNNNTALRAEIAGLRELLGQTRSVVNVVKCAVAGMKQSRNYLDQLGDAIDAALKGMP